MCFCFSSIIFEREGTTMQSCLGPICPAAALSTLKICAVLEDLMNWFIQFTKKNQFRRMMCSWTGHHSRLWITANNVLNNVQFLAQANRSLQKTSIYYQESQVFVLSSMYMLLFYTSAGSRWLALYKSPRAMVSAHNLLFYWRKKVTHIIFDGIGVVN